MRNQVDAGCDVIKLFDSWAGIVPKNKIIEYIITPTRDILNNLQDLQVKKICFPKGIKDFENEFLQLNFDIYALDFYTDIGMADQIFSKFGKITQGNFDPAFLLANNYDIIRGEVDKIRAATRNIPHIFNLGHGVLPETPVKNMEFLVEYYRESFL